MKVIVVKDYTEMCKRASRIFAAQVTLKPDSVLGLATGSTPVGMYKELVQMFDEGRIDFSQVKTVNLDEYAGLPGNNDQSYRYFMNQNLFDHINIDKANTNVPDGTAADLQAECERYEQVVASMGGVDIQLLGIGNNGHIAFNEASDHLIAVAHTEKLTESTINANARFFEKKEDVPTMAITMGMGDILAAKKVVLAATGLAKVPAIKGLIMDDVITTQNPSTMLKMHEDAVVVIDRELADAVGYRA